MLYLERFSQHGTILAYEPERNSWNVFLRAQLEARLSPSFNGYFEAQGASVFGVYATNQGPVFFAESKKWELKAKSYTAELSNISPGLNRFSLNSSEKKEFELEYKVSDHMGIDNWSDEENTDFFYWLNINITKPEFINRYTI